MEIKHKQKIFQKAVSKISDAVIVLLLGILAVMAGIQFGNLWYKLDVNIVESIDTQNFRNTINAAFPIIETIYNSGKFSVSLSGEIKGLFSKMFGFDLDSPHTVLNAQSPIFMSYSKIVGKNDNSEMYAEKPEDGTAGNGTDNSAENGKAGTAHGKDEPKPGNNENMSKNGNTGENGGTGNGNTGDLGQRNGNRTGSEGENGVASGHGNDTTGNVNPAGKGNEGRPSGTEQPDSLGGKPGGTAAPEDPDSSLYAVNDLQPVSSIALELEDENENSESDTVLIDKIVVRNFTKHNIDIAALMKEPLKIDLSKKGPKVLIYHTHTSESYVPKEQDLGRSDIPSFSNNPKYSVVRVGEELARNLRKYGIETLHNGTVHDKDRDSAYGQSIKTLQSYQKSYPSIKVFIDIHRDGLDTKNKLRLVTNINGKNAAQIMFVVGSDGLLPHPGWKENLKFVLRIQQKLNEKYPGLARPVWIVGKRYNQHISNQAILVEVGGDGNLLSECLESTKYLAEALYEVMTEN